MEIESFDLLFTSPEYENCAFCDGETVDGLLVREIFKEFAAREELECFIRIAEHPLANEEDINRRRAVLNDFFYNQSLLKYMTRFTNEFETLVKEQNRSSGIVRYRKQLVSLQMAATELRQIIELVKSYAFLYRSYKTKSQELTSVLSFIAGFAAEDCSELYKILEDLENMSVSLPFHTKIVLNEYGRLSHACLISVKSEATVNSGRRLFPRKKEGSDSSVAIEHITDTSLEGLTNTVRSIRDGTVRLLSKLKKQLWFYNTALKYRLFLETSDIPCCYPSFSDKQDFSRLYDVYLLTHRKNAVPYTFTVDESMIGCIIRGDNNSGKTVFLRSVGICQLLAQLGLPVPAAKCSLKLYKGIFYASASAESPCGAVSRFENEVIRISSFYNQNPNGYLLLLNEIFQSTKSEEGADCLYNTLKCADTLGNNWYAVTHIEKVAERFRTSAETGLIQFGDNFSFEFV